MGGWWLDPLWLGPVEADMGSSREHKSTTSPCSHWCWDEEEEEEGQSQDGKGEVCLREARSKEREWIFKTIKAKQQHLSLVAQKKEKKNVISAFGEKQKIVWHYFHQSVWYKAQLWHKRLLCISQPVNFRNVWLHLTLLDPVWAIYLDIWSKYGFQKYSFVF